MYKQDGALNNLQDHKPSHYLTHSWWDKGVHTFPKGISPNVNVIVRLEFEVAYLEVAVNYFSHDTMQIPPGFKYSYLTSIILFNNIHLFTVKWFQVFLSNINNSIQYYSFVHS